MANSLADVMKAVSAKPEVLVALKSASSPEARAQILRDNGIEPPTQDAVNSYCDELEGVSGGGATEGDIWGSAGAAAAIIAASAV